MPVEILKASVGDYSVNTSKRGVTVNQVYLGEPVDWMEATPVHKWYLANPKATVAQVAEQLDKLPKEVTVRGYKIKVVDVGPKVKTLDVVSPDGRGRWVSWYPKSDGDDCIQYLRKHYNGNKSTDVAECARLIEEYFNPSSVEVQGYKVTKKTSRLTGECIVVDGPKSSGDVPVVFRGPYEGEDPVIAYLRTVMTPKTTVRETAKLIEDFLKAQETLVVKGITVTKGTRVSLRAGEVPGLLEYLESKGYMGLPVAQVAKLIEEYEVPRVVKGITVSKSHIGTTVSDTSKIPGLSGYLVDHDWSRKSVAQVTKLIEDYKFTKVTVETEDGKKEFGSVNDAMVAKDYKGGVTLFVDTLGSNWHYLGFDDFGILFNHETQVTKTFRNRAEAKQYVQDTEIPF